MGTEESAIRCEIMSAVSRWPKGLSCWPACQIETFSACHVYEDPREVKREVVAHTSIRAGSDPAHLGCFEERMAPAPSELRAWSAHVAHEPGVITHGRDGPTFFPWMFFS